MCFDLKRHVSSKKMLIWPFNWLKVFKFSCFNHFITLVRPVRKTSQHENWKCFSPIEKSYWSPPLPPIRDEKYHCNLHTPLSRVALFFLPSWTVFLVYLYYATCSKWSFNHLVGRFDRHHIHDGGPHIRVEREEISKIIIMGFSAMRSKPKQAVLSLVLPSSAAVGRCWPTH